MLSVTETSAEFSNMAELCQSLQAFFFSPGDCYFVTFNIDSSKGPSTWTQLQANTERQEEGMAFPRCISMYDIARETKCEDKELC